MKKLVVATTLGLALGFPSLSFASDYMDLYTKPVVQREVKDEIKSEKVESDFTSFYTTPKAASPGNPLSVEREPDDEGNFIVFGVRIPHSV